MGETNIIHLNLQPSFRSFVRTATARGPAYLAGAVDRPSAPRSAPPPKAPAPAPRSADAEEERGLWKSWDLGLNDETHMRYHALLGIFWAG